MFAISPQIFKGAYRQLLQNLFLLPVCVFHRYIFTGTRDAAVFLNLRIQRDMWMFNLPNNSDAQFHILFI